MYEARIFLSSHDMASHIPFVHDERPSIYEVPHNVDRVCVLGFETPAGIVECYKMMSNQQ